MNPIETRKEMMRKQHHGINLKYLAAVAIPALLFCLSACDSSGSLGKSKSCTCPKPTVELRTGAIENLTVGDIVGYSRDGDMDTVRYIIDHLKEKIPLPRWHSALESAVQSGHVEIAEVLIKEMAKLPDEYKTLSKRNWDQLVINVADSEKHCCYTCDALRFIFKHAKHIINNPLEQIRYMSDCKLQACIDFGFLNAPFKNGNKDLIAEILWGASNRMKHDFQVKNQREKSLLNGKIAEEAIIMVKRLLANGYRPSPNDMVSLRGSYTEEDEAKDTRKKLLKLLGK